MRIQSLTERAGETKPAELPRMPRPDSRMLRQVLAHGEAINKMLYEMAPISQSSKVSSYDDMRLDATIAACLDTITGAVLADPWTLTPAGKTNAQAVAVAADLEANLHDLPLETILENALDALWRGFFPHEVTWKYARTSGRRFWIDSICDLDTEQIAFELDARMNITAYLSQPIGDDHRRVEVPKLWLHRHRPSRKDPAGRSVLDAAHRPWNAKDNYLRFYGLTLQRYGMPLFLFSLPSTADSTMQDAVLEAAYALRLDGVCILPTGVGYTKEDPPQWHGLDFEAAISLMDGHIMRRMLLALSSSGGSGQTYITGDGIMQQARSTAYLLRRVSRNLCESFTNGVIKPLVYANYGERPDLVPRLTLPPPGETNLPEVAAPLAQLKSAGILTAAQAANFAGFEYDEQAAQEHAQEQKAEAQSEDRNQ